MVPILNVASLKRLLRVNSRQSRGLLGPLRVAITLDLALEEVLLLLMVLLCIVIEIVAPIHGLLLCHLQTCRIRLVF